MSVISVSPPSSLQSWQLRHEHGSVTCHHLQSPLIWSIKGDGFAISTKPERNETACPGSRIWTLEFHEISWMLLLCRCTMWSRKRNPICHCYSLLCYDLPYTTKNASRTTPNPPHFWEIRVPIIEVVIMELAGSLGEHLILRFYWLIHGNVR